MAQEDALLRLISRAYQAGVEPDIWPDLLNEFAATIGGIAGALHWFRPPTLMRAGARPLRQNSPSSRANSTFAQMMASLALNFGILRGGVLEKFGPRDEMLEELKAVPQAARRKVAALAEARSGEGS